MLYKNYPRALTIALSENVYQKVKEIAASDRISMAETIRYCIEQSIKDVEFNTSMNSAA